MNDRIWVNRARTFAEAEEFDRAYYESMSGEERLDAVQQLREEFFRRQGIAEHEDGTRLRRVLGVLQHA